MSNPITMAAWTALDEALEAADRVDLRWIDPPPVDDDWRMAADTLRVIVALVGRLRPRHIVEFGSGLSTEVLAWACDRFELACPISSIDHDPEFGRVSARTVRRKRYSATVKSQIAPLVLREYDEKEMPLYHLRRDRFASGLAPDLVIVDGPPNGLGGRLGTLYQVMDFARPGTIVLLDDAARPDEQSALRAWQSHLAGAIEARIYPQFKRGLAAVVINEPVALNELRAHRLRLARDDVSRAVPPGRRCILVDQNQWPPGFDIGRPTVPFLERDGEYWGLPPDSETATRECIRLQRAGAEYIAFAWPAFWWLDHYAQFHEHLRANARCVFENDRVKVFALGPQRGA